VFGIASVFEMSKARRSPFQRAVRAVARSHEAKSVRLGGAAGRGEKKREATASALREVGQNRSGGRDE